MFFWGGGVNREEYVFFQGGGLNREGVNEVYKTKIIKFEK